MPGYRFARPVGIVLTLLCVAFFVHSLLAIDARRLTGLPVDSLVASLFLWMVGYAILLAGVSLGFVHLIQASGHRSATPGEGVVVWGKANIAKYLPGNVLHFAGRQMIGARLGWPQGSIATASLLEIALQVVLPCGLAVVLMVLFGRLAMLEKSADWVVPVLLLLTLGAALLLAARGLRHWLPSRLLEPLARLDLPSPRELLPALGWQLLFFVGMAVMAWSFYALVVGYIELRHLPVVAAAFLISWVMGFVIPGAPGGIGVREGAFAALGGVFLTPDVLVIVAVLMRLVTLLGEGLFFLVALHVDRQMGADATQSEPQPQPQASGARRRG